MKERIYEQISIELKHASRLDVTVTIIAIVVTFILFGMSYAFANSSVGYSYLPIGYQTPGVSLDKYATASMFIGLIAILVINLYSIFAIRSNVTKKTRLVESLAKLSQEEGTTAYYPGDISAVYKSRKKVLTAIIATIGSIGIIIPVIVFINRVVEQL